MIRSAYSVLETPDGLRALTSLTFERATLSRGITMALSNAFIRLGCIVGPLPAGFVFDVNIRLPYLVGAGAMLVGGAISLTLGRERQPASRITAETP